MKCPGFLPGLLALTILQLVQSYPTTQDCTRCQPGHYVNKTCSGVMETECAPCNEGTFLADPNLELQCTQCTVCEHGESLPCNSTSDAVCADQGNAVEGKEGKTPSGDIPSGLEGEPADSATRIPEETASAAVEPVEGKVEEGNTPYPALKEENSVKGGGGTSNAPVVDAEDGKFAAAEKVESSTPAGDVVEEGFEINEEQVSVADKVEGEEIVEDGKEDEGKVTATPVEEGTAEPVGEVTMSPVEEITNAPVEEVAIVPEEDVTDAPVEEVTMVPIGEVLEEPKDLEDVGSDAVEMEKESDLATTEEPTPIAEKPVEDKGVEGEIEITTVRAEKETDAAIAEETTTPVAEGDDLTFVEKEGEAAGEMGEDGKEVTVVPVVEETDAPNVETEAPVDVEEADLDAEIEEVGIGEEPVEETTKEPSPVTENVEPESDAEVQEKEVLNGEQNGVDDAANSEPITAVNVTETKMDGGEEKDSFHPTTDDPRQLENLVLQQSTEKTADMEEDVDEATTAQTQDVLVSLSTEPPAKDDAVLSNPDQSVSLAIGSEIDANSTVDYQKVSFEEPLIQAVRALPSETEQATVTTEVESGINELTQPPVEAEEEEVAVAENTTTDDSMPSKDLPDKTVNNGDGALLGSGKENASDGNIATQEDSQWPDQGIVEDDSADNTTVEEVDLTSGRGGVAEATEKVPTLEELEAQDPNKVDDGSGDAESGHGKEGEGAYDEDPHKEHTGASHKHKDSHGDKASKRRTAIIVGVAVGGVALFTLAFFTTQQCKKRRQGKEKISKEQNGDATELAPLSASHPSIILDIEARNPNGLHRNGPKMGPPSPRTHRKNEGKFVFPDATKRKSLDVPANSNAFGSTSSIEDEEPDTSPRDKLLPSNGQAKDNTPKIVIQTDDNAKSPADGQGESC